LSKSKRLIIKLGSIVAKWLEQKAYNNASAVIAQSNFIKHEIQRVYGVDSTVVYAGIDTEFFKPTHNLEIEYKYRNKQVILHVASYLSPMKGTDMAVKVMEIVNREFPHALLLIINSGNEIDRQYELYDRANECGAYIRFIAKVEDSDMPVYYSMAKCILSPSLDENVHFPVMEGGACETPSVCLKGSMPSEDVVDGETGIMADDVQQMAESVCKILRSNSTVMGENARIFIKQKFNWDKAVEQYKEIIYDSNL
jgi:glycosyltransferase involved in cell wall biosynthesis